MKKEIKYTRRSIELLIENNIKHDYNYKFINENGELDIILEDRSTYTKGVEYIGYNIEVDDNCYIDIEKYDEDGNIDEIESELDIEGIIENHFDFIVDAIEEYNTKIK